MTWAEATYHIVGYIVVIVFILAFLTNFFDNLGNKK